MVGVRPHDITFVEQSVADTTATVVLVEVLGRDQFVHLRLAIAETQSLIALTSSDVRVAAGASVGLRFRRDRLHRFDAASGARIRSADSTQPLSQ